MDIHSLLSNFLVTDNPLLPHPLAMRVALPVIWALVLGAGVGLLACKLGHFFRRGLVALVMLWALLPGSVSPVYWLGLAFQTPSLMSGAIALMYLVARWRREPVQGTVTTSGPTDTWQLLSVSAVVLGWVLLLDTLALLPESVYAWGFGTAAFALVVVFVVLLWVLSGGSAPSRQLRLRAPVIVLGVLTMFVLTRLPTGNVWDALLDPWLWVALQALVVAKAVRWLKATWRRAPPIRA